MAQPSKEDNLTLRDKMQSVDGALILQDWGEDDTGIGAFSDNQRVGRFVLLSNEQLREIQSWIDRKLTNSARTQASRMSKN